MSAESRANNLVLQPASERAWFRNTILYINIAVSAGLSVVSAVSYLSGNHEAAAILGAADVVSAATATVQVGSNIMNGVVDSVETYSSLNNNE